jgi:hypothetical protein
MDIVEDIWNIPQEHSNTSLFISLHEFGTNKTIAHFWGRFSQYANHLFSWTHGQHMFKHELR